MAKDTQSLIGTEVELDEIWAAIPTTLEQQMIMWMSLGRRLGPLSWAWKKFDELVPLRVATMPKPARTNGTVVISGPKELGTISLRPKLAKAA